MPAFRDDIREYLEIAVAHRCASLPAPKPLALLELIHRAIPYPSCFLAAHGETVSFSLATNVGLKARRGRSSLKMSSGTPPFRPDTSTGQESVVSSRALPSHTCQPGTYSPSIRAGSTAWRHSKRPSITGRFALPESTEQAASVRDNLNIHAELQTSLESCELRLKRKNRSSDG